MKWLPLKMNYLPLIFQEINFVTEEYIEIIKKLREKEKNEEKEKENKSDENENKDEDKETLIKKYTSFREGISKRINELEEFYEDNIEDVRVSNFEKARLRLKKLLMYSYENINRIENSSREKNIFIKENNYILNKKLTEDTKKKPKKNINVPSAKPMVVIEEKNKEETKAKKKLFKNYYVNKKKVLKVSGDEGFLKPVERGKRPSMARFLKDSENTGGFDYDDYSKCREIVFKIKLTPEEYKLLLKEKKNKGHLLPYLFK